MPCTEIRVYTRYPSKTLRKTISLSPPRNFPPLVTKFLPERKTLPSVPRTAHLSTQQKVCSYHVSGTSSKGQKRIVVHYKEKTKQLIKSVNVRPLGETSVSRVYFFRRQSSLCYSDALSGLLDFFPPPYVSTHTALLLPSSACHHPPLPPPVPSTPSVIRAGACTAFGPCLPPPIKLQSCLTACPALNSFTQSGNARAPAPLPSCQTATPLSGEDVTRRIAHTVVKHPCRLSTRIFRSVSQSRNSVQ